MKDSSLLADPAPVPAEPTAARGTFPAVTGPGKLQRWLLVSTYAVAMAWMEAAVVFYLRTLVDRIEPYKANPLPSHGVLGGAELVREAATLVMLLTVGMLAGKSWRSRFGYSALAFGIWDIFYYVFLKVMCGWPNSLLDWDILFLLPLPWWGPVLSPVLIALLMVAWGTLVNIREDGDPACSAGITAWGLNALGIGLALYVFMEDAIRVASQGEAALRKVLPEHFDWTLFIVALVLMAAPVMRISWRLLTPGGLRLPSSHRRDD